MSVRPWSVYATLRGSGAQLTRETLRLGSTVARPKLKGIDGGLHKRWSMWFNSIQRAEPYQPLTWWLRPGETWVYRKGAITGAAWLSSARVVRCLVKSYNERNPRFVLLRHAPKEKLPPSDVPALLLD